MARPIWSGSISFGLVNVPVKLFTAVRKQSVRFNQLHAVDGARIQQKRVCSADGQEVAFEDIARGYEIDPGRYVIIENEELESIDPEATHTIDIEDFVTLSQIDPLFYDASYYLVPEPNGSKAYRLLLDAMTESDRVGIARVVLRTKQYLCALRPVAGALVLTTMNFSDEVVDQGELGGLPEGQAVSERELKMAGQLIDSLTTEWDPSRYHDTHREQLMALIEAKAEGHELVSAPSAPSGAPVIDLMAALEASLKAAAPADGAHDEHRQEGQAS
jgi:DNA end-binding protein Ku